MGEGACVDELTVSGPKYHAIDGVGRTAAESATDGGWVSRARCRLMVVSTARVLEMKESGGGQATRQEEEVEREGWWEYNGGRTS